jgi:hypothetical protein
MLNAKDAIGKIKELLNLEFSETKQKFFSSQLEDGTKVTNNTDSVDLNLGDTLYVVANDGNLVPAPGDMEHTLSSGEVVKLDIESKVVAMASMDAVSNETPDEVEVVVEAKETEEEQKFVSATLEDGTKITNESSDDFEVGQTLYVITEEGDTVKAPEGSHTTESGIQIVVDEEGAITGVRRPDEEGSGSLESSEQFTILKTEMAEIKTAISQVLNLFSEFSASAEVELNEVKKELENFKKSPEVENIKNKTLNNKKLAQSFSEFRVEQLKKYLK